MMQFSKPDDWVISTAKPIQLGNLYRSPLIADLDYQDYVQTSEKYFRPNEVDHLLGDNSKAKKILGWEPETSFTDLVELMVTSDLEKAKQEKVLVENNLLKPTWENPI